jgi:tripartite-type tricarboxylate transporter receptor subunit TctC
MIPRVGSAVVLHKSAVVTAMLAALAFVLCSFAARSQLAAAQGYPVKPVRVIIPAAPGSNTDFMFRTVGPRMGAILGQQLVADYRPGAGGTIGAAGTVKSAADGYTIAFHSGGFVINPAIKSVMPYDVIRDFTHLGIVADVPSAMVVHPSLPAANVKQFIAFARSRPGQINFASAGIGTVSHLAGEYFNLVAGVKLVHVPYKSSTPVVVDLLAGQIEVSITSVPNVVGHVRNGRLRMLAQTGAARSVTIPDVPTMSEAGAAGYVVNSGFGMMAPAGLARPIVQAVNGALVKAMHDAAICKALIDSGTEPVASSPEQHEAFVRTEVAKWTKVARAAAIQPQ